MKALFQTLVEKKYTLCTCESLTGGLFASEFVSIPGASEVFLGGIVSYNNQIKIDVVGVDPWVIANYGAVSAQCAQAMATACAAKFKSDFCLSFTGNAGPLPSENKPVGLVYIGMYALGQVISFEYFYESLSRQAIRERVVDEGSRLLLEYIKEKN